MDDSWRDTRRQTISPETLNRPCGHCAVYRRRLTEGVVTRDISDVVRDRCRRALTVYFHETPTAVQYTVPPRSAIPLSIVV